MRQSHPEIGGEAHDLARARSFNNCRLTPWLVAGRISHPNSTVGIRRGLFCLALFAGTFGALSIDGARAQAPAPGSNGHSREEGQTEADPHLHRLRGDEIRALVVGRSLSHDVERAIRLGLSAMLSPHQETFERDGTVWVRLDRGATMSGRYEIVGDQLCLALNNGVRECRYLFRAADGAMLQKEIRNFPISMTPIIIE